MPTSKRKRTPTRADKLRRAAAGAPAPRPGARPPTPTGRRGRTRTRADRLRRAAAGPQAGQPWLGPAPPISAPYTHALLTGILCAVFQDLEIGAAIMDGITWYAIHTAPSI